MAKIKHFDNFPKMSSITGAKDGVVFELRVQESRDWPLAPWLIPTVNQLRKLLKYAQTGALVPDRLVGDEGVDVIAFVLYPKGQQQAPGDLMGRISRLSIYMSPEGWRFMLHPQATYNPLGLLQAEPS